MSVILLETAVGGSIVLWASGAWGAVRRGFFLLVGVSLMLCALAAWLITADVVRGAAAGAQTGLGDQIVAALAGPAGSRAVLGLGVFTGLLALWQVLLIARQETPARIVGLAASAAGVVALVLFAFLRPPTIGQAIAELALGSVFLGSTLFGLLLGHWYLVERRLSKVYMVRSAWWYSAGVVAAVAAVALSATNPAQAPPVGFNPLLAIPGFTLLLGGGLVAICGLIAAFVWKLAQEGGRSIQAATGMFYLAVLMAFSAEMSTKVRFF